MTPTELAELAAFVSVASRRSFSRAAVERGISPSAVSHAVRHLEERLGVQLLHRTTRSVSLTEAGQLLFARVQPAFTDLRNALDVVNAFRDTPYGMVRLNAPRSVAPLVLAPVMGKLLGQNPGLRVDVSVDDRLVDIVSDGYDAGIRFGERIAQDMVAVRLGIRLRWAVVASPDYFHERPMPETPHDLQRHLCIRYNFPSGVSFPWEFSRNGSSLVVDVNGPLTLDDQELMVEAAVHGAGVAFVWEGRAEHHLRAGRLVGCLADWCPPFSDLFLYYPRRRHVSAGLRAVVEALKRGDPNRDRAELRR
ncbi:MAG TPA: LysR family transcriptional regulator [Acetobacteraceae bacterium]|nr:LysR family transcriptional regulator [Acetobacteraceae bacterium]